MGRYYEIPNDTFDTLQLDAGVLLKNFDIEAAATDPTSAGFANEDIICATSGGVNPSCVPTYSDLGDDVDNVPPNMMELKHLDSWEVKLATTSLGTSAKLIKLALGCADISEDGKSVIPRRDLKLTDFSDIWWVGDKANGGFVAIQIKNALATGGFSLQTSKNGKGTVSIEITGHVSINAQKQVPMVIYSIDPTNTLEWVKVEPDAAGTTYPWTDKHPEDMQENIVIGGGKIKGTLKYIEDGLSPSGPLSGSGNFMALKFSNLDPNATSVKVGLEPSQGTGLVEIIDDPDKNGVFKVTSTTQKFKVISTDGTNTSTQEYSLANLVLEDEGA